MLTKWAIHNGRRYRYELTTVGFEDIGTDVHFTVKIDEPIIWKLQVWFEKIWTKLNNTIF